MLDMHKGRRVEWEGVTGLECVLVVLVPWACFVFSFAWGGVSGDCRNAQGRLIRTLTTGAMPLQH